MQSSLLVNIITVVRLTTSLKLQETKKLFHLKYFLGFDRVNVSSKLLQQMTFNANFQ